MSNTIKVSKEFSFNGSGLWLGAEISIPDNLSEGEKINEFIKEYNTLVKAAQVIGAGSDIGLGSLNVYAPEPPVINRAAERLEIMIDKCTTLQELVQYNKEAEKYGLDKQFANKAKEIQEKEELLNKQS